MPGDYYYQLAWSSVDGAGSSDEQIEDQEDACRRADEEQAKAGKDGNPWGYTYRVRRRYRTVCRTDDVYNARTKQSFAYWGEDGLTKKRPAPAPAPAPEAVARSS